MAQYGRATCVVQAGNSSPRLESFGYCNNVLMSDLWPFTQAASQNQVSQYQTDEASQPTPIPVVFIQRIGDALNQI